MSALFAMLLYVAALAVYTGLCYLVFRWMFIAELKNWADHMEPYYKPRFIAGIRFAAAIVQGKAHDPYRPAAAEGNET